MVRKGKGGVDETGEMDLFILSSFAPLGGAMSLRKPSTDASDHLTWLKNEFILFYSSSFFTSMVYLSFVISKCVFIEKKTQHKRNGLEVFNSELGILG